MWHRTFIRLILLFAVLSGRSQNKMLVGIQKNDIPYPEKKFFFAKVIDARTDQSNIGVIYNAAISQQYYADFKQPLKLEVGAFLKSVYPDSLAENQLILSVNQFEIGHVLSSKDTGFVKLDLDFYKKSKDSLIYICNYTGRFAKASADVALTHYMRINRALIYAVETMEAYLDHPIGKKPTFDEPIDSSGNKPVQLKKINLSDRIVARQDTNDHRNDYPAQHFLWRALI